MDVKDRIRVEESRQPRKEIRRSERHLIVRIHAAKYKHHAPFWHGQRARAFEAIGF